jgi:3-deoxy-D-manno-octulosonic-acid transferase
MEITPSLYRAAVRAAALAAPLLERGDSKLARGLRGRRGAHDALAAWGERERDPARPTVWLHAPSVGEGQQVGAVFRALAEFRPGLQAVFTHFSPSAERLGERIGARVSAYLPWDLPGPTSRALDAVRPDLLVFTKTEVWPVLVDEALRRRVPIAIVAATVAPGAGRLRWPAHGALRATWASLALACACSEGDAARTITLGVPASRVHVTGDPGVDAAAERAAPTGAAAAVLVPFRADRRPTIVAGSTWADDEAALLPALKDMRRSVADVRVVVAPHEPREEHVRALSSKLTRAGWRVATLAEVEARGTAEGVDAVVVERVGVLASLYAVADAAYVGGGFGRRGLHSVLEPAAARVPVLFGPRHERSAAAAALLVARGARSAPDSPALAAALGHWLSDAGSRAEAAKHAFAYIESQRGAAHRTAALLDPLIRFRPPA